jgi:hypothetical protein
MVMALSSDLPQVLQNLQVANAFGPLPPKVAERHEKIRAEHHIVIRRALLKQLAAWENKGKERVDKDNLTEEEKEERSQMGRALAQTRWKKEKLSPKERRKLRR